VGPKRNNLAECATETWAPPPLEGGHSRVQRLAAAVRRYFDLQAGSIWNDIAEPLSHARGKVVDVGCGGQPYRSLLPPNVEYIGIDIAESRAHFGYRAPDTVYFGGPVWPNVATGADLVLCTEVLEHVLDPSSFLREAYRCLRPGGRLLLTVPFAARWHFVPHDYWRFTPSALNDLLKAAGFSEIDVFARGNAVTVASYKTMALFLPLLAPQNATRSRALLLRSLGALGLPLFVFLAAFANASLRVRGDTDCLGFTASAVRPRST
jgi:SAM-dependent methyltransferase